ncbi:MAG TPA: tetratricopeptide repeat protein [Steroidobacteraceae bacterium]|nr:tetratricopeptide repeat protein [Steroidobacteraceae bacterium]
MKAGFVALPLLMSVLLAACAVSPAIQPGQAQVALPKDPNALLLGAEMALQHKEYLLASRAFAAAAAASDDEALAERATRVAFEHHQNSYVVKGAKRWLEINATSEEARRFAAFAALRFYRIDEAAEHLEILLKNAYISPQAGFVALLPQLLDDESRTAAMAVFKILVTKFPNLAEAHYALAQTALAADNSVLALTSAQRAVDLSPYWPVARSLLARAQSANGQHDAALATLDALLQQRPTAELRLEHAHLLFAAGKEAESRAELEKLTQDTDAGAGAQRTLALFDMDSGQFDSAAKRYRDLVVSGRFVYEGLFRLGQISERRNSLDDAFELYSRVTDGDFAITAQGRAARLKARSGSVAEGLEVLEKFSREHEELAIESIIAQSTFLADMNEAPRALQLLESSLAEYPDDDSLRVARALLLERMKKIPDAIAAMRALAHDRPADPTALNMLGYTLVDHGRDVHSGFDMIHNALTAVPDNAAILDSMGWALHRLNKSSEALPYLERAYERGHDPEIALHVGEVLWSLNRQDDARAAWQKALLEFPDHTGLKERLEKRKGK